MTLRELNQSNLFPESTYIYFHRSSGCEAYIADFSHKVTVGNCIHTLIDQFLDREISFLDPTHQALIVYFKEDN